MTLRAVGGMPYRRLHRAAVLPDEPETGGAPVRLVPRLCIGEG